MLCTGLHLSLLLSYPRGSAPGGCSMLMHTLPSLYILGWKMSDLNFILGGFRG